MLPVGYRSLIKVGWLMKEYKWVCVDGIEILEHRHIMQIHLGRKLLTDEIVHHINGNKTDNRLENLELMDRDTHTSHHRDQSIPCIVCGKFEKRSDGKGYKNVMGYCPKHYYHYRLGRL